MARRKRGGKRMGGKKGQMSSTFTPMMGKSRSGRRGKKRR